MLRSLFGISVKDRPGLREGEFWALDDVNLSIRPGEAIGLVGPNGAGKSTLLKMIAGSLQPDFGSSYIGARVSKLMSLSAEFQQNLSGRENIYLVGAVRGLSRGQINKKLDEIIAFAELGDFIDAPFYTYSQGMRLRLGFSVAVHAEAPIMLIDEVLAVGDIQFRQKCLRKLMELKSRATYILASHSNSYISQFCNRTLVFDSGAISFDGPTREALAFLDSTTDASAPITVGSAGELRLGWMQNDKAVSSVEAAWLDNDLAPTQSIRLGSLLRFRARFRLERAPLDALNLHVQIGGEQTNTLLSFSNRSSGVAVQAGTGDIVQLEARLDGIDLSTGRHGVAISIFDGAELLYRSDLPPLRVDGRGTTIWGEVQARPKWTVDVTPTAGTVAKGQAIEA